MVYIETFDTENRVGKDNRFSIKYNVTFSIKYDESNSYCEDKIAEINELLKLNSINQRETDYHPSATFNLDDIIITNTDLYLSNLSTRYLNNEINKIDFLIKIESYFDKLKRKEIVEFKEECTFEKSKNIYLVTIIKVFIYLYYDHEHINNYFFWEDIMMYHENRFKLKKFKDIFSIPQRSDFYKFDKTIKKYYLNNKQKINDKLLLKNINNDVIENFIILFDTDFESLDLSNLVSYFKIKEK